MSEITLDKIGHYYQAYDGHVFKLLYVCKNSDKVIAVHCDTEITYVFHKDGRRLYDESEYGSDMKRYLGDTYIKPFFYEDVFGCFNVYSDYPCIVFTDKQFKDINRFMKFKLTIQEIL